MSLGIFGSTGFERFNQPPAVRDGLVKRVEQVKTSSSEAEVVLRALYQLYFEVKHSGTKITPDERAYLMTRGFEYYQEAGIPIETERKIFSEEFDKQGSDSALAKTK